MKNVPKVGIITINDNLNFGNRLQNYAVQEILNDLNVENVTIKNDHKLNYKPRNLIEYHKRNIKYKIEQEKQKKINKEDKRLQKFMEFNKNINFSKKLLKANIKNKIHNEYDYFVAGSDQIWNPNFRLSDVDFLHFADNHKKIAFSASIGVSKLPDENIQMAKEGWDKFKAISVREDRGKEIIEEITGRNDVQVLLDPTLVLPKEKWEKVIKKPDQLEQQKEKKYILKCFLGTVLEEWQEEIERIARENDYEIIDVISPESIFSEIGPSEFLYLEKNAFLICTDSYHSCIFSIIFESPFVLFRRSDKNLASMHSRIETLFNKFNLHYRQFNGNITEEMLKSDYEKIKEIIEKEKIRSNEFLKRALDLNTLETY